MDNSKVYKMIFAMVYPYYVEKVEKKGKSKQELDLIICWLTGYDQVGLERQIEREVDFEGFFAEAPEMHPNVSMIKGLFVDIG